MRLTRFSDYALRVLVFLAVEKEGRSSISQIARSYQLPQNHLVKVVHFLGQEGYLKTVRGKGGGLSLARKPEDINLREVIEKTESNLNLVECFSSETDCCVLSPGCRLKGIFHKAVAAFLETLEEYTLADAVRNPVEIRGLLAAGT